MKIRLSLYTDESGEQFQRVSSVDFPPLLLPTQIVPIQIARVGPDRRRWGIGEVASEEDMLRLGELGQ